MKTNIEYQKLYENLSEKEKKLLYELVKDKVNYSGNYRKLQKLIFRKKPPTPEEFLDSDSGWLSPLVVDGIYDHVKEDFLAIVNNQKNFFQVVQYGATRIGKTFLARLLIVYTIVYLHHLRDPNLYYGVSKVSFLAIYLLAFKIDKTKELLLDPFFKILEMSERFKMVKFQDQVREEQNRIGLDYIVYSKASKVGEITLDSGLNLILSNDDPMGLLGADILQMYVTEISFFIRKAGATEEKIYQLYSDGLDRIKATVGNSYLAFSYLDTSANSESSLIEKEILNNISREPDAFYKARSRWDARPHLAPKWQKTGETFKVITGDGNHHPQIVTEETNLKDVPKALVMEVPIDFKSEFERNLKKSIKDIGGKPTSDDSKFIPSLELIESIFDGSLDNIVDSLTVDLDDLTENLIWNKLRDRFFVKYNHKNYCIRRAPKEKRFIGVDLAYSVKGDFAGLCVLHKEWSEVLDRALYIADFCFAVVPGRKGINLGQIQSFLYDLKIMGGLPIHAVYTDSFQSEAMIQFLQQKKIDAVKQSVDKSTLPYSKVYSKMLGDLLRVGKNIFLKNNFDSLYTIEKNGKEKIDHSKSKGEKVKKYNGDWNKSEVGLHGKDVSDSLAQAIFGADQDESKPVTIYERENERLKPCINMPDYQQSERIALQVQNAYKSLQRPWAKLVRH